MDDLSFVQGCYPINNVLAHAPDLKLVEIVPSFHFLLDPACEIPARCQFHDSTQHPGWLIKECFLIADHIGVLDGSKYSDLVEGIPFIFVLQVHVLYLLHCVF